MSEPSAELRDQAAAYVLGALDDAERRAFEAALADSPALAREVAELREVSGLLALGAPPVVRDDDALKRRLLERVRGGAGRRGSARRGGWLGVLSLAAAAVLAVLTVYQARQARVLRSEVTALRQRSDSLGERLARREETLDAILEPSTRLLLLTTTGERPPAIQLFWNRTSNKVIVHVFNLKPAEAGRAYQLWFLGGAAPVPGGTFNADPDGHALVTLDGPPAGAVFAGAAVTEEPAGGSAQPTSPIIVAGE